MKRVPTSDLTWMPADQLRKHPDNPRRGNVDVVAASIRTNGFYGALLVQSSTRHIIAGNHRFEAGCIVGLTEFPVFLLDVTDIQAKRIMLADNRTNDIAGYDEERLCDLLQVVAAEAGLEGTGYHDDDLAQLIKLCDTARPAEKPLREIKAANAKFNLLHVEFLVPREQYTAWLEELRQTAGFTKAEMTREILCRLGL